MGKRPKRFTVAQVTALCEGKLPHANGFAWERVEYFLLEEGKLEPYAGRDILPGPGLALILKDDSRPDHWEDLAFRLRQYMKQITDERLLKLYQKLMADGWGEPTPSPQSTRYTHLTVRAMLMQAVSIETIERREGRVPSVK